MDRLLSQPRRGALEKVPVGNIYPARTSAEDFWGGIDPPGPVNDPNLPGDWIVYYSCVSAPPPPVANHLSATCRPLVYLVGSASYFLSMRPFHPGITARLQAALTPRFRHANRNHADVWVNRVREAPDQRGVRFIHTRRSTAFPASRRVAGGDQGMLQYDDVFPRFRCTFEGFATWCPANPYQVLVKKWNKVRGSMSQLLPIWSGPPLRQNQRKARTVCRPFD